MTLSRVPLFTVLAVVGALVAAGLAGCDPAPALVDGKVVVVAGENVWGNIAAQIGGDHVEVTSIIDDPNTDPHEYEASDKNAVAAATARLVIENGAGYDDFLPPLLQASPASGREVLTVADVLGVSGSDPNPHLWYDTAALPKVAAAIATALGQIDPAQAATFTANAQAFDASLAPLRETIAQIKAGYAGTKIAYTERVPGYLTQAAGLVLGIQEGFAQAVEEGSDPSPKDTLAFDNALTNKTVKVLLYNAQVTDTQTGEIRKLAIASGIPVVGMSEMMPPGATDFQDWQLDQAQQLLAALEG